MRHIATVLVFCLAFYSVAAGSTVSGTRWIKVEGGAWSPQDQTVIRIKKEIESYVKSQAKIEHKILQEWKTYIFQYQGQEENGKQFVFINAFCTASNIWKSMENSLNKELVLVEDGGTCFFNLKYDPEKNSFFELRFNGEA